MEPEEFMYMLENVKELYIIFAFARKLKIIIVIPLYLYKYCVFRYYLGRLKVDGEKHSIVLLKL